MEKETRIKYLKHGIAASLLLLLLFSLSTFGLVWAVVALTQQLDTGGSTPSVGLALVSSETGETLRTARGQLLIQPIAYNESAVLLYQNSTLPSRRRVLLSSSQGTYEGDVLQDTVLAACQLLLEGNTELTSVIEEAGGDEDENIDFSDVTNIQVQKYSRKQCAKAIKSGSVVGLRGNIVVDGVSFTVYCPSQDSDCHILRHGTSDSSDTGSPSKRRLQTLAVGGELEDEVETLQFGSNILQCSAGQCSASYIIEAGGVEGAGRRQLLQTITCPQDSEWSCSNCRRDAKRSCEDNCFSSATNWKTCFGSSNQNSKCIYNFEKVTDSAQRLQYCRATSSVEYYKKIGWGYYCKELKTERDIQYCAQRCSEHIDSCQSWCLSSHGLIGRCYAKCNRGNYNAAMDACHNYCDCDPYGNNCYKKYWCNRKPVSGGGCFPGDARVVTPGGSARMDTLRIGDRVLSLGADGTPFFDEIYMFGHKDVSTRSQFVTLTTQSGASLRLTGDHHVPVERWGQPLSLASSQVEVGDTVVVVSSSGIPSSEVVVFKSLASGVGLWNPYTLGGRIIVDGVDASSHSSWVLDGAFHALGISIPTGYQTVFAPLRAVYRLLGPQGFSFVEPIVDAVAAWGNALSEQSSGSGKGVVAAATVACTTLCISSLAKRTTVA